MSKRIIGLMSLGLCLVNSSCILWNNNVFAYTTDSITNWSPVVPEPTVSLSMNQPIVGDNNLDRIEGLPSSTSFYKPIGINVSNVQSYYISTYLDCSSLTDDNKTKCEAGNLLTSSGDTLSSVSSAKTFSTMNNEWGFRYNIGNSAQDPSDKFFSALPTDKTLGYLQYNGAEQIRTNTSTNSDSKTLTLGFGAKVDGDTAAGTYNGKVTVAVVASPVKTTKTMADLTYMQQMTHGVCANSISGVEYSLRDTRDNHAYKVAKLADGNCWMIQNLALNSGETEDTRRQLSSASTDLPSGETFLMPISQISPNWVARYDFPTVLNGTHKDNKYDNYLLESGKTLYGYGDGSGDNTGSWYDWRAAMAAYPSTARPGISICPKGWKLPDAGKEDEDNSGNQFKALYAAYGNDYAAFGEAWHPGFVGIGNISSRTHDRAGSSESWWTGAYEGQFPHNAQFTSGVSGYFRPVSQASATYGFSVRCVAR